MEARLGRVISMGLLMGAVAATGLTWLGLLPRVVPAVVEAKNPSPAVSPRPTPEKSSSSGTIISGPPYAIQYSPNDLLQLHQLSQDVHWQPWLPTKSPSLLSYVEAYIASGVLCVIIGPYLVEEANHPLPARQGPTSVTPITLSNGDSGSWWWVPGEGGSFYRLNVKIGSIYVRISGSNSLPQLSQLAETFQPLMALR